MSEKTETMFAVTFQRSSGGYVVQGIEADHMREGSGPPVDDGLGGTVSDPLGGIAVLVDVAEAAPGREVGGHEALKPGRLSRAGAADRVGVMKPVADQRR